jgi:hypothetical protein
MKNPNWMRSLPFSLCACVALASVTPAFAQRGGGGGHSGGGGGGWHGGGGGGWHGGGGGWHGGGGGWRGGYGWHGGYGWYGGYWPWGWGLGALGVGLYFASLPYYYSTYWWGGVPYYYADNNYFIWDSGVGQYQTVAPPVGIANQVRGQAAASGQAAGPTDLIAYPKNGQTEEQQGKDKFECHRWAVSQAGFDPTQPGGGSAGGNRSSYLRAQAACLEGRGYSVK